MVNHHDRSHTICGQNFGIAREKTRFLLLLLLEDRRWIPWQSSLGFHFLASKIWDRRSGKRWAKIVSRRELLLANRLHSTDSNQTVWFRRYARSEVGLLNLKMHSRGARSNWVTQSSVGPPFEIHSIKLPWILNALALGLPFSQPTMLLVHCTVYSVQAADERFLISTNKKMNQS